MFGAEERNDRFIVGLGGPRGDAVNGRFGIWRRPKRRGGEVESAPPVGEMAYGTTVVDSRVNHPRQTGYRRQVRCYNQDSRHVNGEGEVGPMEEEEYWNILRYTDMGPSRT